MKNYFQGGAVLVFLLFAFQVWGNEKDTSLPVNADVKPGAETAMGAGVVSWALATDLVQYGVNEKNPMALLLAAQMIKSNATQDSPRDKETEGKGEGVAEGKAGTILTAENLLSQAKEMAGDNLQLTALIDTEAKRQGTRGRKNSPAKHQDRVDPGTSDVYFITFTAREKAEVAVVGDGDNDLDLFVYDENDNLIEEDTDHTDKCYVSWTPRRTASFKVKIKNLGSQVYSNYLLLTN